MTLNKHKWMWMAAFFATCAVGRAQNALITLVPESTAIYQGEQVVVEAYIEDLPRALRTYQVEIVISGGLTGTLDLATPDGNSVFVNRDHTNPVWVFADAPDPVNGTLIPVNIGCLRIAGTYIERDTGSGPFPDARYLGTYVLEASTDALGDFDISIRTVAPTPPCAESKLRGIGGSTDIMNFTTVGTTISVTEEPIIPSNDNCANAQTLAGDGVFPFTTINATSAGPTLPFSCDEGNGVQFGPDVWFNYTSTCSGILTMSTCGDADFDTRLAVYGGTASTCTCPSAVQPPVSCSDDEPGCAGGTSHMVLTAVQNRCYSVRVGGFGTAFGSGNLTITCIGNDTCASARVLTLNAPAIAGSTSNTNVDSGLPACGPFGSDTEAGGVWYRVTGTNGVMTASVTGASFDSRVTVFEGSSCSTLTCVDGADNLGSSNESIGWCASVGSQYYVLVHGAVGETGAFQVRVTGSSCNDNNACTDDSCVNAACVHDNDTPSDQCCSPSTGGLTTIDDNNPCTTDSCNPSTGQVSHPPVPNGPNEACDDGMRCTLDQCISGSCQNRDIDTISCANNNDCPGDSSTCVGSLCNCIEDPTLSLVAQPGGLPDPTCHAVNDLITVRVEMSSSPAEIVAGQFFLEYDAATLQFVSMNPGSTVDGSSPFSFELRELVDGINGTIDYAVVVPPPYEEGGGTAAPATLAVIVFRAVNECSPYIRFRAHTPPTVLTDVMNNPYMPITTNAEDMTINGTPPVLTACPTDSITETDQGMFTAVIDYISPTASDSCDGPVAVDCVPSSGSVFSSGVTNVVCSAQNACGVSDSCSFDVEVIPSQLTVDVELSPTMNTGTIDRCITFDLWDCNTGTNASVDATLSFTNGFAGSAVVEIPGGQWSCVTARDPLHTLRSTAPDMSTLDFVNYTASFVGNSDLGGHWLQGGNLNGDTYVDIFDYVIFLQQFFTIRPPSTPCGTLPYHTDIDGSGIVELADFSFIQVAFFDSDEPGCCGAFTATALMSGSQEGGPQESVTLQELRRRGLGHFVHVDMNNDGKIDSSDVAAYIQSGGGPLLPTKEGASRTSRKLETRD